MKKSIIALKLFILLTVICGLIYPFVITVFGQIAFPSKSNGSMIFNGNKILGSELIGQQFAKPEFFWGRPSAIGNNPMPSGGSNLNPLGETFRKQFNARIDSIKKYYGNIDINSIPKDLLFASASGVDPHISPEAAYFQVDRVAKFRHFSSRQINKLNIVINSLVESPDLLIFGEYRVNVLLLNLRLEKL